MALSSLRFFRQSQEHLFLLFSLAFLLIIIGVVDKNRSGRTSA